jgi:hypothetical protein
MIRSQGSLTMSIQEPVSVLLEEHKCGSPIVTILAAADKINGKDWGELPCLGEEVYLGNPKGRTKMKFDLPVR